MDTNRFKVFDRRNNEQALQKIVVGNAFAFLDANVLKESGLSWVAKLFGHEASVTPHIVSLMGPEPVELLGVKVSPASSRLQLRGIVSDKNLYRQDKDTINLFVFNPMAPNSAVTVLLISVDSVFSRHKVELGANGEGSLKLKDLPSGEYALAFEGAEDDPACDFVVAEYRLVPLVASLLSSQAEAGGKLQVVLQAESFGVPVNGPVRLDLLDRHHRIMTVEATANDGTLQAQFMLKGLGPFTISVQMVKDPSKTATVPLRGSREEERSQTVFSPLGTEVVGSLLPIGATAPVRGIYLSEGALRVTPIALERVDDDRAKFVLNSDISLMKVVVVDPTYPRPRTGDVDVDSVPHPAGDPVYKEAEKEFKKGNLAPACQIFESRRKHFGSPHPYYAYWVACCYARSGQIDKAVEWLRQSLLDGWTDFAHMRNDEDLSSLRGYAPYESLLGGGIKEISFSDLGAGHKFEIEAFTPMSLIVIGAYVDGQPWEGWTTVVAPSPVSVNATVPDVCAPGKELTIDFDAPGAATSIYAIVKDARLISADTPELKLAAAIKNYVESTGKELCVGNAKLTMIDIVNAVNPFMAMTGDWGSTPSEARRAASAGSTWGSAQSVQAPMMEAGGGGAMYGMFDSSSLMAGLSPGSAAGPPLSVPPPGAPIQQKFGATPAAEALETEPQARKQAAKKSASQALSEDPEVLFAGFVPVKRGKGTLKIELPNVFADYIVECFAISGMHWGSKEVKFRAAKDPFVQLTAPVFARADEPGIGMVHVGSNKSVRVKVLCDGKPISIFDEKRKPFNSDISGPPATFTFAATPGTYEAILEEDGKTVASVKKRVDEPGRLRRIVRSLRILEAGQTLALADDSSIVSIGLLPGIEKSFELLVDATADYSHCCCEQTAAKILSGCAMYMLANGDDDKRKKAESIIMAGIRREKSMWLRGRGFKSYPGNPDTPDTYYGSRAARYLWNLSLLKTDANGLSAGLKEAIEEGLDMADDTTRAYALSWPPAAVACCEDAYSTARFSQNGRAASAVAFVQAATRDGKPPKCVDPYLGESVFTRKEAAYAAATLFRSGENTKTALALANTVISQFNAQGRLYSTCDSVAAIALMAELNAAGITEGGGDLEVNGAPYSCVDAIKMTEQIKSVKVLNGVATVAVDRIVEEDWSKYSAGVQLRISLEKDGQHSRKFTAGDTIELSVTLEDGYKMGDLLWVALPDSLSRVFGGGQIKLFSVDFAGRQELRIALAATGITESIDGKQQQQSLAVCVRNMFEEERAGNPGLISISVAK